MEEALQQFFGNIATPQVKEWIYAIFDQSGNSAKNKIFEILNWLFFAAGIALALFHLSINVIRTAATGEGEPTKATYVGWLRSVIGLLLLPPVFAGYSAIQVLALTLMLMGSSLAQIGWNFVTDTFYSEKMISNNNAMPPIYRTVDGMMLSQLCFYYTAFDDEDFKVKPVKLEGNGLNYTAHNTGWFNSAHCGRLIVPDLSEKLDFTGSPKLAAAAAKYDVAVNKAISELNDNLFLMMRGVTLKLHPNSRRKTDNVTIGDFLAKNEGTLHSIMTRYKLQLDSAFMELGKIAQDQTTKTKVSELKESEWVFAGGYYRAISDINYSLGQMSMQSAPETTAPEWERVYSDPDDRHDPNTARDLLGQFFSRILENWDYYQGGYVPSVLKPLTVDGDQENAELSANRIMKMIRESMAALLVDYGDKDFKDMHPLAKISDLGFRFEVASVTLLTLMALGAVIGPLIAHFGPVLGMFNTIFFLAAGLLTVVFPMIPYVLFSVGIYSWIAICIGWLLLSPIWVIGNINLNDDTPIMGTAWTGAVQIILTPILLIVTLMIGYALFGVASEYITSGFAQTFDANTGSSFIYAPIFYALIFGLLHVVAAVMCFLPIIAVPGKIVEYVSK